ncbi:MAG: trypsin-like serine protease [Chloroflexaceae bacterium]|nr:trypsin-like serine protease [Chloroflexaceae bacterium]
MAIPLESLQLLRAPDLPDAVQHTIAQVQQSVLQVRSQGRGLGAAVIWSANGRILTNQHVVANPFVPLSVVFSDGRTSPTRVVKHHPTLDLALLAIEGDVTQAVPPARIAESARLRVGELVFAVGHPWGQRGMVTAGIISGWGRIVYPNGQRTVEYILSDVLLGPGNSGGPLVNADGAVVGINTMIQGGDLSVAIPTAEIQRWLAPAEHVL